MTSVAKGWIDVLPKDWHLIPAKAAFSERREPNRPDDVHLTPSQLHGVLPQSEYMAKTGNSVVQNIQGQDNMKHVEPDDFIIHLRSFQGGIERSKYSGKVSTAYTVLKPSDRVVPSYFRWLLKSSGYIQELRTTTNQLRDGQSIKFADFAKVQLPCPPHSEQRVIADYLDHETAHIDMLIEEQQRLIELLRERRQGVLSRASDGDWTTVRLGLLLEAIKDGTHGSFSRTAPGEGMPLLGARNIMGSQVVLDGAESFISDEDHRSIVANGFPAKGDVLLVIVGATIGKTAVYDLDTHHAFQRSVAFLRPTKHFESKFLWYQIQASRFQDELTLRSKTSAQPGIYLGDVAAIPVVVPSREEQRHIVAYLDEQTAKIDALIEETERFIELARERRTALITAAVTGQIDVRET